jgi:hypothetical protein
VFYDPADDGDRVLGGGWIGATNGAVGPLTNAEMVA